MKRIVRILLLTALTLFCSANSWCESGVFSVSATKKIVFSPGNLQYQASTSTWRFAEHQYDFVGNKSVGNVYVGATKSNNEETNKATYSGWRDLFGWSCTNAKYGIKITSTSSNYSGDFVDWGGLTIKNGATTDAANTWFTLTKAEWTYILSTREEASDKWFYGSIQAGATEIYGLFLIPDTYTWPTGVKKLADFGYSKVAHYTSTEWNKLEAAGAVFLPETGYFSVKPSYDYYSPGDVLTVNDVSLSYHPGTYWVSDKYPYGYSGVSGYYLYFLVQSYYGSLPSTNSYRSGNSGLAVRLVKEPQKYTITTVASPSDAGSVSGSGSYYAGEEVTVEATPSKCYQLVKWSNTTGTKASQTIKVTKDLTITATFSFIAGCDPNKVLTGKFWVSDTTKVTFSPGNLQYNSQSSPKWRFAENQYDYIGDATSGTVYYKGVKCNNANYGLGTDTWVDLIGWSHSGSNFGTATNTSTYKGNFVDWGTNQIKNGTKTDPANKWRTLNQSEWNDLFGKASYCGGGIQSGTTIIYGYFLIPEDYKHPTGVRAFSYPVTSTSSGSPSQWSNNIYDTKSWTKLEDAGVVFLPVTGQRDDAKRVQELMSLHYWTASGYAPERNSLAYRLNAKITKSTYTNFTQTPTTGTATSFYGRAVRLVEEVPLLRTVTKIDDPTRGKGYVAPYTEDCADCLDWYGVYMCSLWNCDFYREKYKCESGEKVIIYADIDDCYEFVKWSDGNTQNPRVVTVTADKVYTAVTKDAKVRVGVTSNSSTYGDVNIVEE